MGKKAREIVKANLREVIMDLTTAYSDEWLAHYQYWLTAKWIKGMDADTLRPVLEEQSLDELGHANKLATRIMQLGGSPVMNPSQLIEKCGCGYKEPPKDPTDLQQVVRDVLHAEACAIGFYSKMSQKYRSTDVVTHEIFEDLLKDEVDDEEEWERFLSKA
ncbi:MAG: ferritin-like domain-containing protein [Thaumarchaeota archaeon]|nr:ferritin-like domain-containing protein [Nitrososphaerota archaeon]